MNRLGQLVTLDHSSSMLQVMKYDRGQATIMPKVADHSGVNKETRISYSVLLQDFLATGIMESAKASQERSCWVLSILCPRLIVFKE